jgi:hypothetical protein
MTTKTKGKLAKMEISNVAGGGSGFAELENLNKLGGSEKVDSVDTTVFNSASPPTYKDRGQTLGDATFSGEGFGDYVNATNQRKLWDNLETDVETWLRFYYDGTHYRKARVEVSDITFSIKKDAFNGLSFNAKSTGTISYGT